MRYLHAKAVSFTSSRDRELNDWGSEHDCGLSLGDDLPPYLLARAAALQHWLRARVYQSACRELVGPSAGAGGASAGTVAWEGRGDSTSSTALQSSSDILARIGCGDVDCDSSADPDPDDELAMTYHDASAGPSLSCGRHDSARACHRCVAFNEPRSHVCFAVF